ncbi:helix-turn-helix domain-containing protein [Streptacidiphilus anmyonensis]|uniref:helix-turn-helix domain-containing protein n=1 Tax=Streptacidiphilus anmyonensis TaxID=405782 RepID=UPI000694FAD4|nr:helix-turn-helix domain-containing protein [Streptacidiphilus anmyonensis]
MTTTESVEVGSRFGALLRGLRSRTGLTQEQLAERAGLGVRTVQRLETGRAPDVRMGTVKQAAHALADELGRDRDEVWQELAAAHRDARSPDEAAAAPAAPRLDLDPGEQRAGPVTAGGRSVGSTIPIPSALTPVADSLAQDVHSRWTREQEQRLIHDPFPLPVRWRSAPDGVLDRWENIRAAPAGAVTAPVPLDGTLAQIVSLYRSVPSGRLVVLGEAGSGKSVLAMRFVLDHLASRRADDPVPVLFTIGGWDPTATGLRDWLVERLLRDHPSLAVRVPGRRVSRAAALVDAGAILPVLDGFDELAQGLRRAALQALNEVALPLLLTSRTEQFADACRSELLRGAAGIELCGLTADDLVHYLPRTARPSLHGEPTESAASVWDPVLDALRERPDSLPGANLATALSTPLMVLLARTLYSETPDQDPAVLLDTDRFPTPRALEEHLLAGFVPTVYRPRPPGGAPGPAQQPRRTWHPTAVRRYLRHLAGHLDRSGHLDPPGHLDRPGRDHRPGQRGRQDLAWWQLAGTVGLSLRILAVVLACTVVTIGSTALVSAAMTASGLGRWITPGAGPLSGLTAGPIIGLAFGLAYGIAVAGGRVAFEPSRVRLRFPGRRRRTGDASGRRVRTASLTGLLIGFVVGVAYGPSARTLGVTPRQGHGTPLTLTDALLVGSLFDGVTFALAIGFALGLMAALEAPLDPGAAATAIGLLAVNRTTVLRQALLVAPLVTLTVAVLMRLLQHLLRPGPPYTLGQVLVFGAEFGLTTTLCYALVFTAWGQWILFTRLLLPLTGRLPWATLAFLEDAYRRGVLRQVGAVYQFRHARLQHHLAGDSTTADSITARTRDTAIPCHASRTPTPP